jgi:hypothetical protein
MFKSPEIEWCSFLSGFSKPNRLMKIFIDLIKDKIPIMTCPMKGRYEISRTEVKGVALLMIPKGTYKYTIKSFDETKSPLMVMTAVFMIDD